MPFADAYTLRARVQPAFIVVLPIGILLFALLPNLPLFVSAFIGLIGAAGGAAVVAQLGRELGRRKEPGLWKSWDGPPTTRLLRHRRNAGDIALGSGLRDQIGEWVRVLRDASRDQARFPLVFAENVNYGFRRNLWGLKPIGASIAVALGLFSWTLLVLTVWGRPWPDPWWGVLANPDTVAVIRLAAAIADTVFAALWLLLVKPSWVKASANAYALRLLESVQTLRRT